MFSFVARYRPVPVVKGLVTQTPGECSLASEQPSRVKIDNPKVGRTHTFGHEGLSHIK